LPVRRAGELPLLNPASQQSKKPTDIMGPSRVREIVSSSYEYSHEQVSGGLQCNSRIALMPWLPCAPVLHPKDAGETFPYFLVQLQSVLYWVEVSGGLQFNRCIALMPWLPCAPLLHPKDASKVVSLFCLCR
jgi:hypothetical protein